MLQSCFHQRTRKGFFFFKGDNLGTKKASLQGLPTSFSFSGAFFSRVSSPYRENCFSPAHLSTEFSLDHFVLGSFFLRERGDFVSLYAALSLTASVCTYISYSLHTFEQPRSRGMEPLTILFFPRKRAAELLGGPGGCI